MFKKCPIIWNNYLVIIQWDKLWITKPKLNLTMNRWTCVNQLGEFIHGKVTIYNQKQP